MARPRRSNHESARVRASQRKRFIDYLAGGLSITAAAAKAGCSRVQVYQWRKEMSDFAAAWDGALEAAIDRMEDECDRRAVDGVDRPVFQGGKQVGTVRDYSDVLLMFRLKGLRPDKYRERSEVKGNIRFSHEQALDQLE